MAKDSDRLELIDNYRQGNHQPPYMPDGADAEYRKLAQRSVTNFCELVVQTPVQALYVDNFRRAGKSSLGSTYEMEHWQTSSLDQRQTPVYLDAISFGFCAVLTERKRNGKVISTGLSPLRTVLLYEDPAVDSEPVGAVYVRSSPADENTPGEVWCWDSEFKYILSNSLSGDLRVVSAERHGASEVPVTQFSAFRDTLGRTWGVIEPLIPQQDRFNQTIFDLLVLQSYSSFEVRTVTGMAPPPQRRYNRDTEEWEVVTDGDGNPVPARETLSARRFFFAEDPDVKFGSLPATSLGGMIDAADLALRHISATTQTPPHFLLGQIANVSAEALEAAETALMRKVEHFRTSFGESWERVFRIAAEIEGQTSSAEDYSGEVLWRDMGASSLAQSADALGKFADSLGIPKRALWNRVPGVTSGEVEDWERIREEDDTDQQLVKSVIGGSGQAPTLRLATSAYDSEEAAVGRSSSAAGR